MPHGGITNATRRRAAAELDFEGAAGRKSAYLLTKEQAVALSRMQKKRERLAKLAVMQGHARASDKKDSSTPGRPDRSTSAPPVLKHHKKPERNDLNTDGDEADGDGGGLGDGYRRRRRGAFTDFLNKTPSTDGAASIGLGVTERERGGETLGGGGVFGRKKGRIGDGIHQKGRILLAEAAAGHAMQVITFAL